MDKRIDTIAEHYGYEKQKMRLMEKIGGFMQALGEYDRAECEYEEYSAKCSLINELVKVQVMLDQFKTMFDVVPEIFEERCKIEIERQMERIEDEQMVFVIDAVHHAGGMRYTWRVPEYQEAPTIGTIVHVQAKGKVKPVLVVGVRTIKRSQAKRLKTMVGETNE